MPTFEDLNAAQGALYKAGKENSPEYRAIINKMIPIWPTSGYGEPPTATPETKPIMGLKKVKP